MIASHVIKRARKSMSTSQVPTVSSSSGSRQSETTSTENNTTDITNSEGPGLPSAYETESNLVDPYNSDGSRLLDHDLALHNLNSETTAPTVSVDSCVDDKSSQVSIPSQTVPYPPHELEADHLCSMRNVENISENSDPQEERVHEDMSTIVGDGSIKPGKEKDASLMKKLVQFMPSSQHLSSMIPVCFNPA